MTTSDSIEPSVSYLAPASSDWRYLSAEVDADEEAKGDARKASDELNGILLASLQMQRLVVLAGSGCSITAGGPSMSDLWEGAVGGHPSSDAKSAADKVNHDLSEKNIELFLSKMESYLQLQEDADVERFLGTSRKLILDRCSDFLDPAKLEAHETFLHRLSRRRVRDLRLKVFTTNYDRCFERAAAARGGVALDGFSFVAPRIFDPRFFEFDIVRRSRSRDEPDHYLEGVFQLYKLHGSVSWARVDGASVVEKDKAEPAEACLIYPAFGKYQQSFVQPHLESMAQYLSAMREPNTCLIVVGFGFNDDHLSEPLLAAVKSNSHLRVLVVGPRAAVESTKGNRFWLRLAELNRSGEDVWFVNASFAEFAQIIPDLKSLSPADALMKAVRGVAGSNGGD